ncbi:MAG TPA: acyltransferase domain-containing protein, partial [Thermoanaerobaculia bacterium]
APVVQPSGPGRPWQLLALSAKTETALAQMTENLAAHLLAHPELPLADVAYTLAVGRRLLDKRRVVVCRDTADAAAALAPLDAKRVLSRAPEAKAPPVAFLFSGHGSQHARMTADLYDREPLFRAEVDRCCDILAPHLGLDLRSVLFPPAGREEEADKELEATRLAQPALFVVEYALAKLWMSWGVKPAAMLGHSIGEYVAACLAGVMPLEGALALVAVRGRLIQALPAGSMLTVSLPEAEVVPLLGRQLSLAAVNAPERCVVSGPSEAVDALAKDLEARGVGCRPLHTSHAFHSAMMEPALAPFLAEVAKVDLKAPQMPYLSNVTGTWITAAQATDPGYWAQHLRGTVRFADGLAELYREPQRALVEVGPGQSLATLARQHPARKSGHAVVASSRHPKDAQDDQAVVLGALGQLWLAGVDVDWAGFHAGERRHRVVLPTYPFEGRHYFIKLQTEGMGAKRASKKELPDWFYLPFWKPSAPPVPYVQADEAKPLRWLVFADEQGLGVEIAERLKALGESVATVVVGQKFADHGGSVFEVQPARREDYDELLAALVAQGGLPNRILHLWTTSADEAAAAASAQELGFYSLLCLEQALGGQKVTGRIELGVVSSGVQTIQG